MLPNKKLIERLAKRAQKYGYSGTATITYRTVSSHDSYGQPIYTESAVEVSCSFNESASSEVWKDYLDVETIDAEIRFNGTKPSKGDTVTLTHIFNRDSGYEEQTFEIVGVKDRDAFGYICALKRVEI